MARSSAPNSAGSQFFICLGTQDFLDGQYTVFGQATPESMSVVESIGSVSTNGSDRPDEDVTINAATVVEV
jgi:cyclophilin family peptidyl-prolyl cis-trans isomerase